VTRLVSARTALVRGALLTAVAGVLAPAFTDAQMADTGPAVTMRAALPTFAPAFANSLAIAQPGPRAESDGLTYGFTLSWSPRAGATAYRVFTWTDAASAWYRTAEGSATRAAVHAFKSGCTAFVVVAISDPATSDKRLAGLDTTNVLRFPLSERPALCPTKPQ